MTVARLVLGWLTLMLMLVGAEARATNPEDFRADARSIERLLNENYAYLDRFPDGVAPFSPKLRAEADAVTDRRSLIRYAERTLMTLADHHANTGSSLSDSWALVPSYGDLWIEKRGDSYIVDAVRETSPASRAGLRVGERLVAVDSVTAAQAVRAFWDDLGLDAGSDRAAFAARVFVAGRRDRPRRLTVQAGGAAPRELELASLYAVPRNSRPPLTTVRDGERLRIRFHDSLGDPATIAAFDEAMRRAKPGQPIVIDLTDTPSGGNTSVARAILGWFVTRPTAYQVHNLPRENRRTGIERQWVEQVLPRPGKRYAGPVRVEVGRWTGSMGEGLAIGFDAIGAQVAGGHMAGLRGAVEPITLKHSGLVLAVPFERLMHVDGTPREAFIARGRRGASYQRPGKAVTSVGALVRRRPSAP